MRGIRPLSLLLLVLVVIAGSSTLALAQNALDIRQTVIVPAPSPTLRLFQDDVVIEYDARVDPGDMWDFTCLLNPEELARMSEGDPLFLDYVLTQALGEAPSLTLQRHLFLTR